MSHTPGPWAIGPHQRIISSGWSIRIADDSAIAYVLGEKNPELRANAHLIVEAPNILRCLIAAEKVLTSDHECLGHIRAAIRRARGEQ